MMRVKFLPDGAALKTPALPEPALRFHQKCSAAY